MSTGRVMDYEIERFIGRALTSPTRSLLCVEHSVGIETRINGGNTNGNNREPTDETARTKSRRIFLPSSKCTLDALTLNPPKRFRKINDFRTSTCAGYLLDY